MSCSLGSWMAKTHRTMDIATYRLNQPKGRFSEKAVRKVKALGTLRVAVNLRNKKKVNCLGTVNAVQ